MSIFLINPYIYQVTDTPVERIANAEAMSFNGVDSYLAPINQPALDGQSAISVSLWFNYSSIGGAKGIIMSNNIGWYIHLSSATNLDYYNGSSNNITVSTSANTWYHLAIVHNGTSLEVWLNGTSLGTTTVSTPRNNIGQNLTIGAYKPGGFNYKWDGKLDEIAIWNTALSASKIQQIYDATAVVGGVPQTANLFTGGLDSSLVYWNRMGDS